MVLKAMFSIEHFVKSAMLCVIVLLTACACSPGVLNKAFEPGDVCPPTIIAWSAESSTVIRVCFDEKVLVDCSDLQVDGNLAIDSVSSEEKSMLVLLQSEQDWGTPYVLSGMVRDESGNSTSFVLPFSGFNPQVPSMVINELLCAGSSTHPDAVELKVLSDGNLAGICFAVGALGFESARFVFPRVDVRAGDFVVLHMKGEGMPEEIDEIGAIDASGGLDAFPYARDFWFRGEDGGLPNTNGCAALYRSTQGQSIDAVLYTDRVSVPDAKYGSFGTQTMQNSVDAIVSCGAWKIEGELPCPEDCAKSSGTTSTRTLCRGSLSEDTDRWNDWHIVPTKGSTLGASNSDLVYAP